MPCTPLGCSILLKKLHKDLSEKSYNYWKVQYCRQAYGGLVIGNECYCNYSSLRTKNIEELVKDSDIVVAAVGIPEMVKEIGLKKKRL